MPQLRQKETDLNTKKLEYCIRDNFCVSYISLTVYVLPSYLTPNEKNITSGCFRCKMRENKTQNA